MRSRILRHILILLLTALFGGLLGATLVRLAPGFGVDEQEYDSRLSRESIQALRQAHADEKNLLHFYLGYLLGLARGELGASYSLNRPVAELLRERFPVTFRSVLLGCLGSWAIGFGLALPGVLRRGWGFDLFGSAVSGFFLCLPSAAVALLFLYFRGPAPVAVTLVLFPRIFRYARNILSETFDRPHVLTARAKGLGDARIFVWHVLPEAAPQLLALLGVSLNLAFAAAIPIEVICDSPGVGQLAWQAALGRDLPLLVNLTVLIALITITANSLTDLASRSLVRQPA